MLVRRRTSDTFFIGAAPRPRHREAREAIARLLQEEGGLHDLRMTLAEVMPAGKAEQLSPEDVVAALADGVAAGRFVLIGFRPRPVWSPASG